MAKPKKSKSVETRLKELEDFHYRVKLGSKWFMCALYTIGSLIVFMSYVVSGLNSWNIFTHGK